MSREGQSSRGDERAPTLTPGATDVGPSGYQLGARLAESGEVYEARHPRFSGQIVVKLFPRATGEGPAAAKAFASEAARISILRHPRIALVLDSGVIEGRTPFVTMERLFGRTLEELLTVRGSLPLSQGLTVVRDIVLALSAAHEAGVVHREIRPDNVFLVDSTDSEVGLVKVLDFGVSRLTWAEHAAGRGISAAGGRYLAPEQVQGGLSGVDARADQFGLAALIYRVLTGAVPSVRGTSSIETALGKALSKRPGDRFSSVVHFFRAFEEALAGSAPFPAPVHVRRVSFRENGRDFEVTRKVALPVVAEVPAPASVSGSLPDAFNQEAFLIRRFFEEGERQEKNRWKNVSPATNPGLGAPDIAFTSFDRVPRRVAPLVVLTLIAVIVLAGLFAPRMGWRSPRAVLRETKLGRTVYFLREGLPWAVPGRATPNRQSARPAIDPSPAPPSAPAAPAAPVPSPPAASSDEPTGSLSRPAAAAAPARSSRHSRSSALRGYVWSPGHQGLVPATANRSVSPSVN
jgi:serine/threonine protein kinase